MMRFQAGRLAVLLSPMLLAVACSSWPGAEPAAQDLGQRLQARLAPDIAAGRATLEQLPDGARVTLVDQSLFPGGGAQLDDAGRDVLTRVIQGLLAPRILRIVVAESPTTQADLQDAQTGAVTQYFQDYGLGSVLQPATPQPGTPPGSVGAAPQGLTITVSTLSS
jgi:hypothetical protein